MCIVMCVHMCGVCVCVCVCVCGVCALALIECNEMFVHKLAQRE